MKLIKIELDLGFGKGGEELDIFTMIPENQYDVWLDTVNELGNILQDKIDLGEDLIEIVSEFIDEVEDYTMTLGGLVYQGYDIDIVYL